MLMLITSLPTAVFALQGTPDEFKGITKIETYETKHRKATQKNYQWYATSEEDLYLDYTGKAHTGKWLSGKEDSKGLSTHSIALELVGPLRGIPVPNSWTIGEHVNVKNNGSKYSGSFKRADGSTDIDVDEFYIGNNDLVPTGTFLSGAELAWCNLYSFHYDNAGITGDWNADKGENGGMIKLHDEYVFTVGEGVDAKELVYIWEADLNGSNTYGNSAGETGNEQLPTDTKNQFTKLGTMKSGWKDAETAQYVADHADDEIGRDLAQQIINLYQPKSNSTNGSGATLYNNKIKQGGEWLKPQWSMEGADDGAKFPTEQLTIRFVLDSGDQVAIPMKSMTMAGHYACLSYTFDFNTVTFRYADVDEDDVDANEKTATPVLEKKDVDGDNNVDYVFADEMLLYANPDVPKDPFISDNGYVFYGYICDTEGETKAEYGDIEDGEFIPKAEAATKIGGITVTKDYIFTAIFASAAIDTLKKEDPEDDNDTEDLIPADAYTHDPATDSDTEDSYDDDIFIEIGDIVYPEVIEEITGYKKEDLVPIVKIYRLDEEGKRMEDTVETVDGIDPDEPMYCFDAEDKPTGTYQAVVGWYPKDKTNGDPIVENSKNFEILNVVNFICDYTDCDKDGDDHIIKTIVVPDHTDITAKYPADDAHGHKAADGADFIEWTVDDSGWKDLEGNDDPFDKTDIMRDTDIHATYISGTATVGDPDNDCDEYTTNDVTDSETKKEYTDDLTIDVDLKTPDTTKAVLKLYRADDKTGDNVIGIDDKMHPSDPDQAALDPTLYQENLIDVIELPEPKDGTIKYTVEKDAGSYNTGKYIAVAAVYKKDADIEKDAPLFTTAPDKFEIKNTVVFECGYYRDEPSGQSKTIKTVVLSDGEYSMDLYPDYHIHTSGIETTDFTKWDSKNNKLDATKADLADKDKMVGIYHDETIKALYNTNDIPDPKPTDPKPTDPKPTDPQPTDPKPTVDRDGGDDRIDTSVIISDEWDESDVVILATANVFADAMAGVPLATALDCPILLTKNEYDIEQNVMEAFARLGVKKVYILGQTVAVNAHIEDQIDDVYAVERLGGVDRFETAVKIAEEMEEIYGDVPEKAFFVRSDLYADALSVSSAAGITHSPILYVAPNGKIDQPTTDYVNSVNDLKAVIAGQTAAVSEVGEANIKALVGAEDTSRIGGADRFETSVLVNKAYDSVFTGDGICMATAFDFPDALTGGALAAKNKIPVLLVGNSITDMQAEYFAGRPTTRLIVFGGVKAIPDSVVEEALSYSKYPLELDEAEYKDR